MHAEQKAAWFVLFVVGGTVALYAGAVPLVSWRLDQPWTQVAVPLLGVFGLLGLMGLGRYFYLRPRPEAVVADERDRELATRAWMQGMTLFWQLFVFGSMGLWAYLKYVHGMRQLTLPIDFLPLLPVAGAVVVTLAKAVATLHAYGWRTNDASK